jgi:hypothetical protein
MVLYGSIQNNSPLLARSKTIAAQTQPAVVDRHLVLHRRRHPLSVVDRVPSKRCVRAQRQPTARPLDRTMAGNQRFHSVEPLYRQLWTPDSMVERWNRLTHPLAERQIGRLATHRGETMPAILTAAGWVKFRLDRRRLHNDRQRSNHDTTQIRHNAFDRVAVDRQGHLPPRLGVVASILADPLSLCPKGGRQTGGRNLPDRHLRVKRRTIPGGKPDRIQNRAPVRIPCNRGGTRQRIQASRAGTGLYTLGPARHKGLRRSDTGRILAVVGLQVVIKNCARPVRCRQTQFAGHPQRLFSFSPALRIRRRRVAGETLAILRTRGLWPHPGGDKTPALHGQRRQQYGVKPTVGTGPQHTANVEVDSPIRAVNNPTAQIFFAGQLTHVKARAGQTRGARPKCAYLSRTPPPSQEGHLPAQHRRPPPILLAPLQGVGRQIQPPPVTTCL